MKQDGENGTGRRERVVRSVHGEVTVELFSLPPFVSD